MHGADPLFVAMTRPASRWGVSLEWLALYLAVVLIGFIGLNSFWPFLLAPVAHVIGVIAFRIDPYFMQIVLAWVTRCSASTPRRALRRSVYVP
jgi:type IV secretory pathway VirB3-like protein